ncbi:MAG: hypothetical protein PHQ04_04030 [Opitutaceae bacterium]|nr:hypothetical protein [Opitutaceae bacterium]
MDNFVPGFKENILALTGDLRVVVFFICVAGLMMQVNKARQEGESLMEPVVRAIVVVALVATLPYWFELTERVFLAVADTVNRGYADHPMQAASLVRDTVKDSDSAFSLTRIHESFYKAFLWAAAKLIVLVGSVLQLPFLLLQHILKLLCYLFLPVALALFMVPSLASLAVRYVQQTLAVLAWPIGFAVTELVTFNLVTAYQTNLAIAGGLTPGQIDASSLASVLGGILGVLWLVIGTLGTPVLMQMLFCSGAPVSGGGQSALQQLYTMQQVAWMVKSVKTGGAAAAAMVAQKGASAAGGSSGGGSGGTGGPAKPPASPAPGAPTQPPTAPIATDPGGDRQAAAVRSRAQLPTPQTTI